MKTENLQWNGLTKASGLMDAVDDAEYSGSLISLLQGSTEKAGWKVFCMRHEKASHSQSQKSLVSENPSKHARRTSK